MSIIPTVRIFTILALLAVIIQINLAEGRHFKSAKPPSNFFHAYAAGGRIIIDQETESQSLTAATAKIRKTDSSDQSNAANLPTAEVVHAKLYTSSRFIDNSRIPPATVEFTGVDVVHKGSYTNTINKRRLQELTTDSVDNDSGRRPPPRASTEPGHSPGDGHSELNTKMNNVEKHQSQEPTSIP